MKNAQAVTLTLAIFLSFLAPVAPSLAVDGEMILNGDFENHTFGTVCWWLSNAEFNSGVSSVTAFGDMDLINLMSHDACDGLPPPSGATKLGIGKYEKLLGGYLTSAFSFDLSSPIVAGEQYKIEFYAYPDNVYDYYDVGQVEIGISTSPTSFGTLVFTGSPAWPDYGWTLLSATFTAPIAATHLTVRAELGPNPALPVHTHIDNFSLVPAGPTSTGANSWGKIKSLYR